MKNAFSCKYDSDEKLDYINRFFEEEELRKLFTNISSIISETVLDLDLRGREQEIIGVSQPGKRYVFYVVPCQNGYTIKFKSQDRATFSAEYTVNLLHLAEEEISLIQKDPDAYQLMIPHSSSIMNGNESVSLPVVPQFDTEPFCKKHNVDPDAFSNLGITQPPFSNRAFNCLARANITSFSQLLKKSEQELSEIPFLGRKTLSEIEDLIKTAVSLGGYPQVIQGGDAGPNDEAGEQNRTLSLQDQSKAIRAEIHDLIIRSGDAEGSQNVHLNQCQAFCEQLESWTTQLIKDVPKISERDRDIFFYRIVRGETLSQVGERFSITRERVRQLCIRSNRKIKARVHRFPDENVLTDLSKLGEIFREVSENELYTLINYVIKKRKLMAELLFSLFIPTDEQPTLILRIENAELPVEERPVPAKKEKTSQKPPRIPAVPTGRYCPRCGAELLVQTARRGANAGRRFVGCSAFPHCWYSEELSLAEADALGVSIEA